MKHQQVVAMGLTLAAALAIAAPAGAKTKLTLATYGSTDEKDTYDQIEKAFEARYPDLDLEVQIIGWAEYITKITTLFAAGTPPDVFLTWAQYKPRWVENGMLLDLTPYYQKSKLIDLKEYYPEIREVVSYKGKLWGTPQDFNSKVYFVNVDLLNEAGVAVPKENWTVNDLQALSLKVTDAQNQIFGTTVPVAWGSLDNLHWTYQYTGHYWVDEAHQRVLVDDPKNVQMHQYWYDMMWKWKVVPTSAQPLNTTYPWQFMSGQVAVQEGWISYFDRLEQLRKQKGSTFEWTILPYPKAPSAQANFAQGHMWSIASNHKNPDKAWLLAEFLGSPEAEKIWTATHRAQPQMPRLDLWKSFLSFLPEKKVNEMGSLILGTIYGKGYAKNFNYWPTYDEMNTKFNSYLNDIFNLHEPIASTLKKAQTELQAILDNYNKRNKK